MRDCLAAGAIKDLPDLSAVAHWASVTPRQHCSSRRSPGGGRSPRPTTWPG